LQQLTKAGHRSGNHVQCVCRVVSCRVVSCRVVSCRVVSAQYWAVPDP
jgi:hypothetical protein